MRSSERRARSLSPYGWSIAKSHSPLPTPIHVTDPAWADCVRSGIPLIFRVRSFLVLTPNRGCLPPPILDARRAAPRSVPPGISSRRGRGWYEEKVDREDQRGSHAPEYGEGTRTEEAFLMAAIWSSRRQKPGRKGVVCQSRLDPARPNVYAGWQDRLDVRAPRKDERRSPTTARKAIPCPRYRASFT